MDNALADIAEEVIRGAGYDPLNLKNAVLANRIVIALTAERDGAGTVISDDLTLRLKVRQLNRIFKEVQDYKREHPETCAGYYPNNYGSLLNAYREGDLSFEDAKAHLAEAGARIAESEASPVADPEANEVARVIAERIRALKDSPEPVTRE